MLPKTIKAYHELGYRVHMGCPARVGSVVTDERSRATLSTGGGFTVSDAFVFTALERVFKPQNIFIIGNSFGLSTFALAELFPNARVDAIDAESEGLDVGKGSEITRLMAKKYFPNVQLTIGFSPQDVDKARRSDTYELVFIDGMHTDEQMVLDFKGTAPYMARSCVVVLHDIALTNMWAGWKEVQSLAKGMGFQVFPMGFTQDGCGVLARGCPEAIEYLSQVACDFEGPYLMCYTSENALQPRKRPFFWDWSFGLIETLVRRKIKKILS